MDNYEKQIESQAKEQEKKQAMQEYKKSILSQILTPQAKDRLNKIKLVKADKVAMIENSLIQSAQSGRLQSKLTEAQLIEMLENFNSQQTEQKITFKRRGLDDDW